MNNAPLAPLSMRLSEPVDIPPQYEKAVRDFLVSLWNDVQWHLENQWGFSQIPPLTPRQLLQTILARRLALIARYAAGEDVPIDNVLDHIKSVTEYLFARPGVFEIPNAFWKTPVGAMILRAQIRAEGDELITLSEAAKISGRTLNSLSGMIRRGTLRGYPDPTEPNPQKQTRVRRSEIEALPPRRGSNSEKPDDDEKAD